MSHWMDKVFDILTTSTADLRELALMAGGNPRTFYRGVRLEDVEFTSQRDIEGMEFGDIAEADIAHATTISSLAKRDIVIATQTISMSDRVGATDFSFQIDYPSFSGAADFSVVNARFAEEAKRAAKDATPPEGGSVVGLPWSYQRRFRVYTPSIDTVTVAFDFEGYSGGAHGYGARTCLLVDVRHGRFLDAQNVFTKNWTARLLDLVVPNLQLQFMERPGFDDALEPNNLRDLLLQSGRYCWQAEKLVLVFNAYEVGPYAAGPYSVEILYNDLKGFLPPDWGNTMEQAESAG